MNNYDDTKIVKSRVRQVGTGWAYVQLEMSPKVVALCFQGLARHSRRVRRRFVSGSREISLAPSLLRASTDALICEMMLKRHWLC